MNDLDQIKEILFGNEKKALDSLVRRLEAPESRMADVADVLPDAVTRSYNQDDRLGKALSQPLETTLSDAIRREPKKFADALFPVMGPAIRKAIAEAIKSTLQTINTTIEHKSLINRFRARRSGVSMAQYVFQKSVVYRIEEVYLVDPESGRLVSYLSHPDVDTKDEDAVSAMFTAIQDFVRDSFSKGQGGGLDSVVIDEFTVLISQGPHAMLACVVRGAPPANLKVELDAINEHVHLRHSQGLLEFDGVSGSIEGLDQELEPLLRSELAEHAGKQALFGWKSKALLGLLALVLVALMANGVWMKLKMADFKNLIAETPGLLLTNMEREGLRGIAVEGLRDPLAIDPVSVAAQAQIKPEHVISRFQTFQSLDAAMVEKRARNVLKPPKGVELTVSDGVLTARGNAPASYREQLLSFAPVLGGINRVDVTGLALGDDALLSAVRAQLEPPASVELSVTQGVLVVSGQAPQEWHARLASVTALVPGIEDVNIKALKLTERVEMVTLVAQLNNKAVFFSRGSELVPNQEADISRTAAALRDFERLATLLKLEPVVRVVGEVDGSGNPDLNESLMVRRARAYRDALVGYGVPASLLEIETSSIPPTKVTDQNKRRAVLKMTAQK